MYHITEDGYDLLSASETQWDGEQDKDVLLCCLDHTDWLHTRKADAANLPALGLREVLPAPAPQLLSQWGSWACPRERQPAVMPA
jgi:hypothetical protein